jgi:hypothetical protein
MGRDLSARSQLSIPMHASHARLYRPGDFIHRQGELARLSVIEQGEVEILQSEEARSQSYSLF